jgi:hypothetical protein
MEEVTQDDLNLLLSGVDDEMLEDNGYLLHTIKPSGFNIKLGIERYKASLTPLQLEKLESKEFWVTILIQHSLNTALFVLQRKVPLE